MKKLILLIIGLGAFISIQAQTDFKTIASNRMVQKFHSQENLQKIKNSDPNRLEALWNYISNSFTFTDSDESDLSIHRLLNIYHFDISQYESYRQQSENASFIFRGTTSITLKSTTELNQLIAPYTIQELLHELPQRAFPTWTSSTFHDSDFELYKQNVWDWARDFPEAYIQLTADTSRTHIRFEELKTLDPIKRTTLLNQAEYIIVD